MAITHTKDNQLNSAPVKVSNYIRIILAWRYPALQN